MVVSAGDQQLGRGEHTDVLGLQECGTGGRDHVLQDSMIIGELLTEACDALGEGALRELLTGTFDALREASGSVE